MENNNQAKELANKIWDETIGKEELMYNKETSPKIHPKNVLCDAMGCVKFDEEIHNHK